jgi:Ca2+-binding RTX toxin-like protein
MPNLINTLGGTQGFGENVLPRSDDGFHVLDLRTIFGASALKFFGTTYNYLAINNNGNVTLSNSATQGMSTYMPFGLQTSTTPIIAPFFADIDTRQNSSEPIPVPLNSGNSKGTDLVYYDIVTTGNGKLTVTWDDVGYYSGNTARVNAFQLELVGQGSGNFDIVFRYEAINWTTGDALDPLTNTGGIGGLGGTPARVGYSAGNGTNWLEVTGSGAQDAMLALETALGNTGVAGFHQYQVRNVAAFTNIASGASSDDLVSGGLGNDHLSGLAGNDFLVGNAGADTLVGGAGNDFYSVDAFDTLVEAANGGVDTVIAETSYTLAANFENLRLGGTASINATGNGAANLLAGNVADNVLDGRSGLDTVSYALATEGVVIDLALAGPQAAAGLGADTLVSVEGAFGSLFTDTLKGSWGANVLNGAMGNDTLFARAGNDTLVGGLGADGLTGGTGQDVFRYHMLSDSTVLARGRDVIRDMVPGEDRIDLSLLDAVASSAADNAFSFIGSNAFSTVNAAGQVRYVYDAAAGYGVLLASTDADASAEFAIRVLGVATLSATDLVL